MWDDGPIAVSLPARELEGAGLPGSVFGEAALVDARFSEPLRRALALVTAAARRGGAEIMFVARPEIFIHGEGLAWLRSRLGPARRHLCLSDGTAVKLIPGLSNHVFFHGLNRRDDSDALRRLIRRAPELLGQLDSQVNTALFLGARAPVSEVLSGAVAPPAKVAYWPVAYDAASLEYGLARTLGGGPLAVLPPLASELVYVALTPTSLGDAGFLRWLSGRVLAHWRDPARALILRLPDAADATDEIADRVRSVLAALESVRARLPSAPAPNVWFADGDPAPEALRPSFPIVDAFFPHSYDFWRQPPVWYRVFRSLTVRAPLEQRLSENFEDVALALTGLRPRLVRDATPNEALS